MQSGWFSERRGSGVAGGRRVQPAWGALLAVVGLALLWGLGLEAGRYQPAWGEAEAQCVLDGRCTRAEVETTLQLLWTAALAGVVLVLVGVVLGTRSLSRALPEPVPSPARLTHAAVAGLVSGVLAGVSAVPALALLFFGPQAVPGALLTAWLVPAVALTAVDRAFGRNSPHRAWLTALALAPVAAVVAGLLLAL